MLSIPKYFFFARSAVGCLEGRSELLMAAKTRMKNKNLSGKERPVRAVRTASRIVILIHPVD